MTTLEKAARQALDALQYTTIGTLSGGNDNTKKAIASLSQALEHHESAYQRGYLDGMAKPCIDCADRKLQAFKQPKQEPVAWMYDWEAEGETVTNWLTSDYDEAHSPTMGCTNIRPLYTEPPKREWVGLTEDERKKAGSLMFMNSPFNAAVIAIENRLQEKNT